MILLDILIVVASISLIIFIKLLDKNPQPILGSYQRKNGFYWLKVGFMYIALSLRQLRKLSKNELEDLHRKIEKPQKLSTSEKPIDAVYMNGADVNGNHLVVGTARRKNLLVDGFLILKIKGVLLHSPKLPGTSLYKDEEDDEYGAEGIKITLVDPMKEWHLSYNGEMRRRGEELSRVRIEGAWTSQLPVFNFDSDMDPLCMAKSMGYEKWNKNYFQLLKAAHQTHYEQFGTLKLVVTIDNEEYRLQLDTIRDHSFGVQREWRQFHRYGLHFFTAANGDHFHVGKICCPITFSRLTIGYVYSSRNNKIYPVQECDLELYQHGEFGTPPTDYAFTFKAGGKVYSVQVDVVDSPVFYISEEWESKFYENLCKFKVNGMPGWGAAEWQYRNIEGRECLRPFK